MVFGLFRKRKHNQAIMTRQYETLTRASRQPVFFLDYGMPDTVMGRFEMVAIVMILFFRRTAKSPTSGQQLAQEIVDAFFQDIDHSIRELGIGDVGVPKRMKKFAGMFYGRLEAYSKAMEAGDATALAEALRRNIHPEKPEAPDMLAMAHYMLETEQLIATIAEEQIATGSLVLPVPPLKGEAA